MAAKEDYLAAARTAPAPFSFGATRVTLRTVTYGERAQLLAWHRDHKDDPDSGIVLVKKLVALALCDEAGNPVFNEAEVDQLDPAFVDAVGEEAGKRCGLYRKDDGEKKAESGTTSPSNSPSPAG